jgi:hypothetical protein
MIALPLVVKKSALTNVHARCGIKIWACAGCRFWILQHFLHLLSRPAAGSSYWSEVGNWRHKVTAIRTRISDRKSIGQHDAMTDGLGHCAFEF